MFRHHHYHQTWRARSDLYIAAEVTHLHALAVIEKHVAEFFGHHVQMSLLALVGPGQNVELGEVG